MCPLSGANHRRCRGLTSALPLFLSVNITIHPSILLSSPFPSEISTFSLLPLMLTVFFSALSFYLVSSPSLHPRVFIVRQAALSAEGLWLGQRRTGCKTETNSELGHHCFCVRAPALQMKSSKTRRRANDARYSTGRALRHFWATEILVRWRNWKCKAEFM